MMKSLTITLLAAIICSLYSCKAPQDQGEVANLPNVVIIYADDLGYGDVSAYGATEINTPNIDRLAARGVRFENAYCQYPLCGPSRASFMSGLYPDQTLIHRNAIYLREHLPDVKTIPQMFRVSGQACHP